MLRPNNPSSFLQVAADLLVRPLTGIAAHIINLKGVQNNIPFLKRNDTENTQNQKNPEFFNQVLLDITSKYDWYPSAENVAIIKSFLRNGADLTAIPDKNIKLRVAAELGDIATVEDLLKKGVEVTDVVGIMKVVDSAQKDQAQKLQEISRNDHSTKEFTHTKKLYNTFININKLIKATSIIDYLAGAIIATGKMPLNTQHIIILHDIFLIDKYQYFAHVMQSRFLTLTTQKNFSYNNAAYVFNYLIGQCKSIIQYNQKEILKQEQETLDKYTYPAQDPAFLKKILSEITEQYNWIPSTESVDIMEEFLRNKADLTDIQNNDQLKFQVATKIGDISTLKSLMEKGVVIQNVKTDNPAINDLLVKKGDFVEIDHNMLDNIAMPSTQLKAAVEHDDLDKVRELLSQGTNIDHIIITKNTNNDITSLIKLVKFIDSLTNTILKESEIPKDLLIPIEISQEDYEQVLKPRFISLNDNKNNQAANKMDAAFKYYKITKLKIIVDNIKKLLSEGESTQIVVMKIKKLSYDIKEIYEIVTRYNSYLEKLINVINIIDEITPSIIAMQYARIEPQDLSSLLDITGEEYKIVKSRFQILNKQYYNAGDRLDKTFKNFIEVEDYIIEEVRESLCSGTNTEQIEKYKYINPDLRKLVNTAKIIDKITPSILKEEYPSLEPEYIDVLQDTYRPYQDAIIKASLDKNPTNVDAECPNVPYNDYQVIIKPRFKTLNKQDPKAGEKLDQAFDHYNSILVLSVHQIEHNNPFLNHPSQLEMLKIASEKKVLNKFIDLGKDKAVAECILDAMKQDGISKVMNIIFDSKQPATEKMPEVSNESTIKSKYTIEEKLWSTYINVPKSSPNSLDFGYVNPLSDTYKKWIQDNYNLSNSDILFNDNSFDYKIIIPMLGITASFFSY